jgi:hypothetical protein
VGAGAVVLDDGGIARILKHIGSKHVSPTLDKTELRKDILAAWDFYQGYKRGQSKGGRTKQRKYAGKIASKAKKFFELLDDTRPEAYEVHRLISIRFAERDRGPSLDALKRDIMRLEAIAESIVGDFYQGYKKEQSKGGRKQRKYAGEIASKSGKFFQLLDDGPPEAYEVRNLISIRFAERDRGPSLDALKYDIVKLETMAESVVRRCAGEASLRGALSMPPSFWLIGHDLARVFQEHFQRSATRRRGPDGLPDGPFVRFVTAATAELGEPFLAETVSKAISAVRASEKESQAEA